MMDNKFSLDSTTEALRIATANRLSTQLIEDLQESIEQLEEEHKNNLKVVAGMIKDTENITPLGDNLYGVRYCDKRSSLKGLTKVEVLALTPDGAKLFQESSELFYNDFITLLPACEHLEYKEKYEKVVSSQAKIIISELCGDMNKSFKVTSHACKRWVQRKLGIRSDSKAEEYLKQSYNEVYAEVLSQFESSTLIWTDEEGIEYWLDENNLVYVVGNSAVITVYEEDFGFEKSINRQIVFSQLEVLSRSWEECETGELENQEYAQEVDLQINQYNQDIKVLEAKILELRAQKDVLVVQKDAKNKAQNTRRQAFNAEFNKLFKKYKDA